MNRHQKLTGAALAVLATTGALAAAAHSDTVGPRTLTFSQRWTSDHSVHVDLGKKGIGAGDMFLGIGDPILDVQTGRRVGTLDSMETILSPKHNGTVTLLGAARLRDGRIEIAGTLRHTDPVIALAVVGGTGAYAGARGELTIREEPAHKRSIITATLLP